MKQLVGKAQVTEVWGLIEDGEITYFYDDEDADDYQLSGLERALEQQQHVGGEVALFTLLTTITAVVPYIEDEIQAWLDTGMQGPCPRCGQDSGFHDDDGSCQKDTTDASPND